MPLNYCRKPYLLVFAAEIACTVGDTKSFMSIIISTVVTKGFGLVRRNRGVDRAQQPQANQALTWSSLSMPLHAGGEQTSK
jgi:hypothetical protein